MTEKYIHYGMFSLVCNRKRINLVVLYVYQNVYYFFCLLLKMEFSDEIQSAVSYSLSHGLLHGEFVNGEQYFTHMPFSLFPFPVG